MRADRILAAFLLDASKPPEGFFYAKAALQEERERDKATKEVLLTVQRLMDVNEENINGVIAQRTGQEQSISEDDDSSSREDITHHDTNALVDAFNPMLQANKAHFKRRHSNMQYFVSSIDEDDDKDKLEEEVSGADVTEDAAAMRGSLIERQRKSWARTTELMDGTSAGKLSHRTEEDHNVESSETTRSLSSPPFPTAFTPQRSVSAISATSSEPVHASPSAPPRLSRYKAITCAVIVVIKCKFQNFDNPFPCSQL